LRAVLLPEELRPARCALAPARRRYRAGARGDGAAHRWPHARAPVPPGGAAADRPRDPRRRRVLLAGAHPPPTARRRRPEPHAGHALHQAAEDAGTADRWPHLPEPRSGVLAHDQAAARRLSLSGVESRSASAGSLASEGPWGVLIDRTP